MEELKFTSEALAGMITEGILMILLPVLLLIVWKIRTKEKILPVIVGALAWFLFAIVLKIAPAYLLLQSDTSLAKTISGNVWLTCLVAGILAGVFEETARFLSFKFVLKKYQGRRTSLTYGIGHGGFESAYVGFQMISLAALGVLLSSPLSGEILGTMDEATRSALVSQMGAYTNLSFGTCMLAVFERIPAIVFHLSLSVLVFASAREKKKVFLYPVAILLHTAFDFSIVLYSAKFVPVWAMELILAALTVPVVYLAVSVYRKLREEIPEETSPVSTEAEG